MIICPECKHENSNSVTTCQNCWHDLDGTAPVSQPVTIKPIDELLADKSDRHPVLATPDTPVSGSKLGDRADGEIAGVGSSVQSSKRTGETRTPSKTVRARRIGVVIASITCLLGWLGVLLSNHQKAPAWRSANDVIESEEGPVVTVTQTQAQKKTNPSPEVSVTPVRGIVQSNAVQQRADVRLYTTPAPTPGPQISLSGQSALAPGVIQRYLQPVGRLAVKQWVWGPAPMYGTTELVYNGYSDGRLINKLVFSYSSSPMYYRQYLIHYETASNGDNLVTVDRYNTDSAGQEFVEYRARYLSKPFNGKLYLSSADRTSLRGTREILESHLDVQWTDHGVRAWLSGYGGRNRQELVLNAVKASLENQFDLWDDFGLKL